MRLLKQPAHLGHDKFTRLGMDGRFAYFQCRHERGEEKGLGIWRVDTLVPSSHKRILFIPYSEMNYAHSTMGRDEFGRALIYILLLTSEDDLLCVRIHEIRIDSLYQDPTHTIFELGHPADYSNPLFNVPLHNAALGVGQRENGPRVPRTVFLYDASITQGDIPYWRILLDRESCTFSIEQDTIPAVDPVRYGGQVPDDLPRMVHRFPVVIDGAKRRFMRFGLDQRVFVFTEERFDGKPSSQGDWIPYSERPDNEQSLVEICGSRQLRETYSRNGHRATAIESRFALIVDGDVCILRHRTEDHHNHYSRLVLDDANLEYYFVPCGVARIERNLSVGKQSYTTVNERIAVIAGLEELAVIDLQPQRLGEIALWTIQKQVSARSFLTGALSDGWSVQRIAEILGYVGAQEII